MVDLSDYDAYLEEDFVPVQFANRLVLSTNRPDGQSVDLSTALKRLSFDLKDIDKKIKASVELNYTDLLRQFESLRVFSSTVEELDPAMNQLNVSYKRLDNEILKPYDECSRIHAALKRIHQTSVLLRASQYFLFLVAKIEEVEKTDQALARKPFKNMALLSHLICQLKFHLSSTPGLRQLAIVREYEQFYPSLVTKCVDTATNHFKLLSVGTYDSQSVINIIYTLLYLSPGTFYNQLQQLISTRPARCVSLVARNMGNYNNFDRVFGEVGKAAQLFSLLDTILRKNAFADSSAAELTEGTTIWDKASENLDLNTTLVSTFWRDVAKGVEPKFKQTMAKGGLIARGLSGSKDKIRDIIRSVVLESIYGDNDTEHKDCLEVTLMTNSVRSLDGRR